MPIEIAVLFFIILLVFQIPGILGANDNEPDKHDHDLKNNDFYNSTDEKKG